MPHTAARTTQKREAFPLLATSRARVAVAGLVLVLLVAGTATFLLLRLAPASAEQGAATLTVFVGSVQAERVGSTGFATARSGDLLNPGDSVRSAANTKAALRFPDGSVTRIDSNTTVKVKSISKATGGGWKTEIAQTSGKTWNNVVRLVGGASFKVGGPNNSTAEARGTIFSIVIGQDASGRLTVEIDVWSGSVLVTGSNGSTQTVTAGNYVIVGPGGVVSNPAPITAAARLDSWTVFNQTADVSPGAPTGFVTGNLSPVTTTPNQTGATGDGNTDLTFTLGWPGSAFKLAVYDPDGELYKEGSSTTPAVSITVPRARAGDWKFAVTDLESKPNEVWWVIVGRISPSTQTPSPFFLSNQLCRHSVTAGQTDTWRISAQDAAGRPALSATGLPPYGALIDGGRGTATLTFVPPVDVQGADVNFTITAALAGATATLTCIETVSAAPRTGSVSGTVRGAGAGVSLDLSPGNQTAQTGFDGSYLFSSLGPGTYTVTLHVPDGYVAAGPTTATVTVAGTDRATADFSIRTRPAVFSVSPRQGPLRGGNAVTLSGTGFTGATGVTFGGVAAAYRVDSDSSLAASAPAHAGGTVDIAVVTPYGSSPITSSDQYTFLPLVTSIAPGAGPATGGTTVVIRGAGFSGATAVRFGGAAARQLTVDSDTQVTAITPQYVSGMADVTVVAPGGTSTAVTAGRFTFQNWTNFPNTGPVSSVNPTPGPSPSAGTPIQRVGGATAFDTAHQVTVLFGGASSGMPNPRPFMNDTWTWDGTHWTLPAAAPGSGSGPIYATPGPRAFAAMAYDPDLQWTVMFGGQTDNNSYTNDAWAWDGVGWIRLLYPSDCRNEGVAGEARAGSEAGHQPEVQTSRSGAAAAAVGSGCKPDPRAGASLVWDGAGHTLVLFGGHDSSGSTPDTWTSVDGVNWVVRPVKGSAYPVSGSAATGPDGRPVLAGLGAGRYSAYQLPCVARGLACTTSLSEQSDILGMTTGRDGNVWFVEGEADRVGYITPSGAHTEYQLPRPSPRPSITTFAIHEPEWIVQGSDGLIYFNQSDSESIGRINPAAENPAASYVDYPLPFTGVANGCSKTDPTGYYPCKEPKFIAASSDGNIWFLESDLSQVQPNPDIPPTPVFRLGRLHPADGTITEFPYVAATFGDPTGLAVGSDGNVWLGTDNGYVGRIAPGAPAPGPNALAPIAFVQITPSYGVVALTSGPDGNLWFGSGSRVGWVKPTVTAGTVSSDTGFNAIPSGGEVGRMTVGADHNLWFTELDGANSNLIGRVTPSGLVSEILLPGLFLEPTGIAAGSDGRIWISLSDADQIAVIDATVPQPATFVWDSPTGSWLLRSNTVNPSPRDVAGMALDNFSGRVVLFGGTVDGTTPLADTWTWDGSNWRQESPAIPPPALLGPALATDVSGGVLLFGGLDQTGASRNQNWKWI